MQNLDDDWMEQNFAGAGDGSVLYKSEAEGDWSWRGEDGDYSTSFEIEAGDDGEDAYLPLISLLDLVNNGTADAVIINRARSQGGSLSEQKLLVRPNNH